MTFKMAVVRYFESSAFEIFILNRHYSRILHLFTQFRENWTISCRLMVQTTFSGDKGFRFENFGFWWQIT